MHYKFTGKERDSESGLDYFGARYYASTAGRWLSPDWSAQAQPVPYAKLADPQTLNLYAYVGTILSARWMRTGISIMAERIAVDP
jgi:RHS repeat-associated protein